MERDVRSDRRRPAVPDQRLEQRRQLHAVELHACLGPDTRPRIAGDNRSPVGGGDHGRQAGPGRIIGAELPLVQVALRDPLDPAHDGRIVVEQVGVHRQVADDRVVGQPAEPGVGKKRTRRVASRRGIDEDVGLAEAAPEIDLVARQVLVDHHDLDPGQTLAHDPRVARVVAAPDRPLDGLLADSTRANDRDAYGQTGGREQRRPAPLEGVEGGGQSVVSHVAQVLDQALAVVAGDHVERDGLDAQAAQQLDALRPGCEMEHREQDRAAPDQLVASLGRPQHHHDGLLIRRSLVDDVQPGRRRTVVVVRVAHAGPAAGLHEHVDIHVGEQAHQRRQEGPSLARLVVHARKADREPALGGHEQSIAPRPPGRSASSRAARGAGRRGDADPGWLSFG